VVLNGIITMGIANYTNLSELMNEKLKKGQGVSISDLVREGLARKIILASEGVLADKSDLELVNALYQEGAIKPESADESESQLIRLFETGKLAENGYGGDEGDRFLEIKWSALTDNLPVITNLNI
jgi:hypothetical protein